MTKIQNLKEEGFTPTPDFENQVWGFIRVERDDRLLDVFSKETLDKGVELWEKWNQDTIDIIRIHNKKHTQYQFAREAIERALLINQKIELI